MNRYEFLSALHDIIKPRMYLEIGVQTGASLTLAKYSKFAVGVDPDMGNVVYHPANAVLCEVTSDAFFDEHVPVFNGLDGQSHLDMVFIDGLHHSEQAFRDLMNAIKHGHRNTVYVLDDVLPRNDGEANRIQCPGDWAGDVWKTVEAVGYVIDNQDSEAWLYLVDTFPTGIAVVTGALDTTLMANVLDAEIDFFVDDKAVPQHILERTEALTPEDALTEVQEWMI